MRANKFNPRVVVITNGRCIGVFSPEEFLKLVRAPMSQFLSDAVNEYNIKNNAQARIEF